MDTKETWMIIILIFVSLAAAKPKEIPFRVLTKAEIPNHVSKTSVSDSPDDPEYYRLPKGFIPETYHLKIVPFFERGNFSFHGVVDIRFSVEHPTDLLVLHAKDLQITAQKVTANGEEGKEIPIKNSMHMEERDFHVICLEDAMISGRTYTVTMSFEGRLRDDLTGFYRSSYKDGSGNTRWMALTHFEPTNARKAFPCFDEPSLKANFTISVARDRDMISLSNMPAKGPPETDPRLPDNYVWDYYAETPKMSTYLVAFIVSQFKANVGGDIRVWTREDALEDTSYSLEVARDVLDVMHNLTNIAYTLPKLDIVAIPDFQGGAMENWGLLTFRDTALLYRNGSSTAAEKQFVTTLVAHELAHQWFGNLVTPEWWKFTWMKEGFATYFQYAIVDLMHPPWRMMEQFVTQELQTVFLIDALDSPHPISANVVTADRISAMFDEITYNKGGSLLRMMEHFLSRNTFFKGLQKYLNSRNHDSGNDFQLFSALDSQAREDSSLPEDVTVKKVMDTWTYQRGYPVITVERNYENKEVVIKQERYVLKLNSRSDNYQWYIPLTYTTKSSLNFEDTRPKIWVPNTNTFIAKISADSNEWLIANIQETGYYRVNYDAANWKLILDYLKGSDFHNVHHVNRAQLLDDAFNLARGGYLPYHVALDLSFYLSNETDFIPWRSANMAFSFLDRRLARSKGYPILKKHILGLINPHFMKMSVRGLRDGYHPGKLIAHWSCKYGNKACISEGAELFTKWKLTRDNSVPEILKSNAYCSGIYAGGKDEWDFLWKEYEASTDPAEQTHILDALGCSRDRGILKGYLLKTIDDDQQIRKHELHRVFLSVSRNVEGVDLSVDFIVENFEKINARYTSKSIGEVISGLASAIGSREKAIQMKEFFRDKENLLRSSKRAVEQAIVTIDSNLEWSEEFLPVIESWLAKHYP